MALVGEKLASDAMLDEVLCVSSGRRCRGIVTSDVLVKGLSREANTSMWYLKRGWEESRDARQIITQDEDLDSFGPRETSSGIALHVV